MPTPAGCFETQGQADCVSATRASSTRTRGCGASASAFRWLVLVPLADSNDCWLRPAAASPWEGALRGHIWGGLVMIFLVHHVTWSVQLGVPFPSAAAASTSRTSRRTCAWLSLLSLGESWHHNHHAFPVPRSHGLRSDGRSTVGPADHRDAWSASDWRGTSCGSRRSASSRRLASMCRRNRPRPGDHGQFAGAARADPRVQRRARTAARDDPDGRHDPAAAVTPPRAARRARRLPGPVFVPEALWLVIVGPAGPMQLRVIAPEQQPTGVFLHIHGGGWTLSASDLQDVRLQRLARDTGMTVVSVEYRLSPEHPYPAGPDDREAARYGCSARTDATRCRRRGRVRSARFRRRPSGRLLAAAAT